MKITKSQLKQIIKEELESVFAEQEAAELPPSAAAPKKVAGVDVDPRPDYAEDIPEWYKGPGGVAEKLNALRDKVVDAVEGVDDINVWIDDINPWLDKLEARVRALEPEPAPEPEPGPAITTGGGSTPQ